MVVYNYSQVLTSTNLAALIANLNNSTGNYIGIILLVVVFSVFFIKFLSEGPKLSFAISMLITAVVATLLGAIQTLGIPVLSFDIIIIVYILTAIGGVMTLFQ